MFSINRISFLSGSGGIRTPMQLRPDLQSGAIDLSANTPKLLHTLSNVCIKAHCHHHHASTSYGGYVCPVCFNTLESFISQKRIHPLGRPFSPCLKCRDQSSLLEYFTLFVNHKTKTPGCLVLGSFGVRVYLYYTTVSWDPWLI